jgi:hypothetical protein
MGANRGGGGGGYRGDRGDRGRVGYRGDRDRGGYRGDRDSYKDGRHGSDGSRGYNRDRERSPSRRDGDVSILFVDVINSFTLIRLRVFNWQFLSIHIWQVLKILEPFVFVTQL